MSEIQMVYNMDHDFVSVQMKRNEEFEDMYRRGLEYYIDGDWMNAQTQWQTCSEITGMKNDGPLRHMLEVIDKGKVQAPEGW